jgi:hypothetical protein
VGLEFSRRTLLMAGGAALGALLLGPRIVVRAHANGAAHAAVAFDRCPRLGVFSDATFRTLESVCEQIVPTDQDPGNAQLCGASLVEAIASSDPETAALIEAGLEALDASSERLHGEPFAALDFAAQRAVLEQVEAGRAPGDLWLRPLFRPFVERSPELLVASILGGGLSRQAAAQRLVFSQLRTLCKLAFVTNFPETQVRDAATDLPIFADARHLISDPDDDGTATGWTIVRYHVTDFETERLLWEWQGGRRVVAFDGIPVLGDVELGENERLEARDLLWARSSAGEV